MGGIENNPGQIIKLNNKKGENIDLNAFNGKGIEKNDVNKSIFEKFDFNKDGKLDEDECKSLQAFLKNRAGNDGILSKREVKSAGLFGKSKQDVKNFYSALNDMYSQQIAANNAPADETVAETSVPEEEISPVEEPSTDAVETPETAETPEQEEVQEPKDTNYKYKVNYQDTWYGIVQAKYGITDHKQTMEIVRQLKAQNNVDPKATNMPAEITLPDNLQLKDGTEIKLANIDAEVDKSHWGYKTTSETGRYTITQNGETKYYAADGTELKQSYYEAREASPDKRKISENGSGRYSYTAENGETLYFEADGTLITEEYYQRRETEYKAVSAQQNIVGDARAAFKQQLDRDGWAGKTADAVSVLWNSDNRAVKVEADLQAYEKQIEELQTAQSKGAAQFSAKFKEIYGVDYNPANIAAYEANPTDENYKKAYGTKNDIHKRVMDYNRSQQRGAAAVKTTVVAATSAAAAVATGGTSLLATAAVAGASTMAARTAVEVTDLATNNIDGDVNGENLDNIAKQAMTEGAVTAVTAGVLKGAGGMFGKAASKAAPETTGGLPAPVPKAPSGSGGGLVRTTSQSSANAATRASNAGANASNAANEAAASASSKAAGYTSNLNFVKDMGAKLAGRGGISNLSSAERSQLSEIIGTPIENIGKMSKSEFRALQLKFHPDKHQGSEFYEEIFKMLACLR